MFAFRSLKGRHLPTRSFKYVLAPSQRSISSSPAQLGKTVDATTSTELKAATETQDIKALDDLLKVVSQYQNECFDDIANVELAALQARRPIPLTTSTDYVETRQKSELITI